MIPCGSRRVSLFGVADEGRAAEACEQSDDREPRTVRTGLTARHRQSDRDRESEEESEHGDIDPLISVRDVTLPPPLARLRRLDKKGWETDRPGLRPS